MDSRSTILLVSQAQRDLLTAQIAQVEATAAYLRAIVNLYRMEGSLLERRGVIAPGRQPIDLNGETPLWKLNRDQPPTNEFPNP